MLHWIWVYNKTLVPLFSSERPMSAELQGIVGKLHGILGSEDVATKMQLKLWSAMGHPHPPASHLLIQLLPEVIKMTRTFPVETEEFWVTGRQKLLDMYSLLFNLNNDQSDLEHVEEKAQILMEELRKLMSPKQLPSSCESRHVTSAPEVTQSAPSMTNMLPVHEHLGVLTYYSHVTKLMQDEVTWKNIMGYVEHGLVHTGISPSHYTQLRVLTINQSKDLVRCCLPVLLVDLHTLSRTSSLAKLSSLISMPAQTDTLEKQTLERDSEDLIKAPDSIYSPLLSFVTFCILTETRGGKRVSRQTSADSLMPSSIYIDSFTEKLGELKSLSSHLWMHATNLSSFDLDVCYNERKIALQSFAVLLKAIFSNISESQIEIFPKLVEEYFSVSIDRRVEILKELSQVTTVYEKLFPNFGEVLKGCLDSLSEVAGKTCPSEHPPATQKLVNTFLNGSCFAHVGLLQAHLLAPKGPVDPAEKQALKLHYVNKEIENVEIEFEVRNKHNQVLVGHDLDLVYSHPHLQNKLTKLTTLKSWKSHLSTMTAVRPTPPQYDNILRSVNQYLSSIGSYQRVTFVIKSLQGVAEELSSGKPPHNIAAVLMQAKSWLSTQDTFIKQMQSEYPLYSDIVMPFLSGVAQLTHGIMQMVHVIQTQHTRMQLYRQAQIENEPDLLELVVSALGQMPSLTQTHPSSLTLSRFLSSDHVIRLVTQALEWSSPESPLQPQTLRSIKKVMWSALLHLRNYIISIGELTSPVLQALSTIFHSYVVSWREAENRKKEREAEESSLYRYKTETHGSELTEEEQDEVDLRENFPSFDQEFEDIVAEQTLDDKPVNESTQSENGDTVLDELSAQEIADIGHVHNEIFSTLTQTQWLSKSTQEPKLSYVEAFLSGYQVAADMVKNTAGMLSSGVDSRLLGGHLLSSAVLQNSVQMEGEQKLEKLQCSRSHPYDIYHDPNVSEVIQCRPILNQFLSRVKELLAEWPDHPALKQITAVINRILSFSITSPLMKFLTGLEVLLEKSQEWEKNASKQVSIQTQLDSVTHLVIQWRRLELRCWKGCLDVTQWKAAEKAWHFWFHIYQLVESFTNPEEESSIHDLKKGLIKAIQQFMESSTLGEYHTRLQLIQAFHCQAVHMDPSSRQEILLNLLWNSHQYYSQFIPAVDAVITRLRTPIEKDLKGFVKIARWTDINFWAMKQAAEKTHRTLHKQMKKFESVLRQPVSPILTEGKEKEESHARSDEGHEEVMKITNKEYLSSESVQEVVSDAADQGEADSILSRLPSLYLKMRKLCRRILQADNHCKHVDVVNEFTGDIISSVQELQAMQVTEGTDKEKQKKEAKHIHQRKRKALADLFKYLSKIGLSYRKGLGAWNHADDTSMAAMLTDPVDVTVALKSMNETSGCDTQTVNAWGGCQSYFIRCLVRRALYHTSLNTPSQELGVANLDRCRGFSEHLMTLTLTQKSELAKTVQEFVSVRNLVDSVKLASRVNSSARPGLPPQSALRQWVDELKLAADQAYESAKQFEILLHCCPPGDEGVVTCPSPLPREELAQVACMRRGDEMWTRVNQLVHDVLMEVCSLKSWYGTVCNKGSQIFTWTVFEQLRTQFEQLTGLVPVIDSIVELFMQPKTSELSALTECLSVTKQHITSQSESFLCWFKQTDQVSCHNDVLPSTNERIQKEMTTIDGDLESIVVDMLLVIQKLLKGQGQKQTEDTAKENGGDENEDEDEEELLDGILVNKTHNSLSYHWTILSLDKKLKSLQMLVTKIKTYSDQGEVMLTTHLQNLLSRCIPVMDQFVRMTQFYLTQSIASHRSTSKLLSVLLGIFTELTLKGFCLPAEYSDEMAGEGAGQFEDIEGGGMGEGEGMKDVSDQIENEDQLDEARKAGEEKDPEDTSQQPDVKEEDNGIEMSEDFDGKLHDLEPTEGEEGESDEEDKNEENELDKQMGDVDDNNADKLDDQVWGSDDDEDEQQENEDSKEESGPGSGKQSEPELVAKDDNEEKTETGPEHGREEQKNEEEDSEKEPKQQELENIDESEYDENQVDPYYGDQQKQEEVQPMDLPDDLNLDEEEEGGDQKDGTAEQEENPFDIDKVAEQEDEEKGKEEEESKEEEAENDGKDEGMDVDDKDDTLKEGEEKEPEQSSEDPASTDKQDDVAMDTEEANPEDAEKKEDSGFEPQEDKDAEDQNRNDNQDKASEEKVESADQMSGQTDHTADSVEQSDTAQDRSTAVSQDDHEEEGAGQAESEDKKGHEGQTSSAITRGGTAQEDRQQTRQKPGQSNVDRSLGSAEEKVHRRLKTTDTSKQQKDDEKDNRQDDADLYEHVKDAVSHHDAQTLDAATADQEQQQQPVVSMEDEKTEQDEMTDEDIQMREQEQEDEQASESKDKVSASKLKPEEKNADMEDENGEGEHKVEIEGEAVATHNVQRPHVSTIHTDMDVFMDKSSSEHDIEILRSELEQHMSSWSQPARGSLQEEQAALEAWHQYEALTSNLSQELCEQLRLVLEPSQATKLKGDYRTGKRLNMRKVIPYIASQFRKDKIWLRRTKPHKRQYQIMIAIDDSSSMMDNHSKQLAFESLSVVANALTLLEAGELGICSFGETVELLHPFHEQFSSHSGSRILQRFTFEQKKTKIAELLHKVTGIMLNARRSPRGSVTQGDISQLLLIVSDGRGLFLEGMEVVRLAVRQAREANVFLVFVIIDNPENKDSILDIRVPFFKAVGQIPEIHSYMDHFPFPFYIILRDINSLPHTLSDALRQWFELVTAADK